MIRVTSNVSQFISRMKQHEANVSRALDRGLSKWVMLAHREAHRLLSGSGKDGPGAYPVPVRTGQLRRAEDYVLPGRSKHGITARKGDAYLINPAAYAGAIHEDRPFAQDGVENTRSEGIRGISLELRKSLMSGVMA